MANVAFYFRLKCWPLCGYSMQSKQKKNKKNVAIITSDTLQNLLQFSAATKLRL